jgi:hypothetical protein
MAFALALTNSQGCVAWTEALSESLKTALALTAQHNHTQTVLNADFTMSFICNEAWVPTSTHADAPRGMNFLYSLNRLNVATSRAKCLSILVCSPALFEPECKTPEQMKMANAFCRYLELATEL